MSRRAINLTKEKIQHAIKETKSMQEAARFLNISYATFLKNSKKFNLFNPNPSGKGTTKPRKFKTENDVFKNNTFVTSTILRKWFLSKNNEYKCSECGIKNWNNKPITLELDHINGNRLDNRYKNLRFLCPNCHSLTDSYRAGNRNKYIKGCPTGFKKSYLL